MDVVEPDADAAVDDDGKKTLLLLVPALYGIWDGDAGADAGIRLPLGGVDDMGARGETETETDE